MFFTLYAYIRLLSFFFLVQLFFFFNYYARIAMLSFFFIYFRSLYLWLYHWMYVGIHIYPYFVWCCFFSLLFFFICRYHQMCGHIFFRWWGGMLQVCVHAFTCSSICLCYLWETFFLFFLSATLFRINRKRFLVKWRQR